MISLIEKIKNLVKEERRIGVEVLECLREIERVKAYANLGYSGLFSFCVKPVFGLPTARNDELTKSRG